MYLRICADISLINKYVVSLYEKYYTDNHNSYTSPASVAAGEIPDNYSLLTYTTRKS